MVKLFIKNYFKKLLKIIRLLFDNIFLRIIFRNYYMICAIIKVYLKT